MAKVIKIAVFALIFGIAAFYYWKTYNQLKDYNDKYQTMLLQVNMQKNGIAYLILLEKVKFM